MQPDRLVSRPRSIHLARTVLLPVVLVAAVLLLAVPAAAQSVSGVASGKEKLKIPGCGKDKAGVVVAFDLDPAGTWSGLVNGVLSYSGTWQPKGSSGRKFLLAFDAGSFAALQGALESDASDLCEVSVILTKAKVKKFVLKLDKSQTRAKVLLKMKLKGMAQGESGRGSYRLKAKGEVTPALE